MDSDCGDTASEAAWLCVEWAYLVGRWGDGATSAYGLLKRITSRAAQGGRRQTKGRGKYSRAPRRPGSRRTRLHTHTPSGTHSTHLYTHCEAWTGELPRALMSKFHPLLGAGTSPPSYGSLAGCGLHTLSPPLMGAIERGGDAAVGRRLLFSLFFFFRSLRLDRAGVVREVVETTRRRRCGCGFCSVWAWSCQITFKTRIFARVGPLFSVHVHVLPSRPKSRSVASHLPTLARRDDPGAYLCVSFVQPEIPVHPPGSHLRGKPPGVPLALYRACWVYGLPREAFLGGRPRRRGSALGLGRVCGGEEEDGREARAGGAAGAAGVRAAGGTGNGGPRSRCSCWNQRASRARCTSSVGISCGSFH